MPGQARWDVLKTLLYVAASVALAATVSSPLFNAGKALAEVTESKHTNRPLERLAATCREGDFSDFFVIALIAASALLFFPWLASLRLGHPKPDQRPWSIRLPATAPPVETSQALRSDPRAALHGIAGFLLAAGLFLLLGFALLHAGSFAWKPARPPVAPTLGIAAAIAIAAATVQELVFRGAILGVFVRTLRPATAIATTAALFALARFLASPPLAERPRDEETLGAGWNYLAQVSQLLIDPKVGVTSLIPLFTLGALLGFARWRTASLWLPIGLHAGWLFAERAFASFAIPLERTDPIARMLAGKSLAQGLVPLACIVFTCILIHLLTSRGDDTSTPAAT